MYIGADELEIGEIILSILSHLGFIWLYLIRKDNNNNNNNDNNNKAVHFARNRRNLFK